MSERSGAATKAGGTTHGLSPELLAILVCPVDHGRLEVVEQGLRCEACQRVYPVRDGVPSMVVVADSSPG